jgi:Cof subfamily protein (haloacid dehalogenase superfamily)
MASVLLRVFLFAVYATGDAFAFSSTPFYVVGPSKLDQNIFLESEISCILSDVDGTLLSSDHKIGRKTLDTIREAISMGYKFFPCTGRTRLSMAQAAPELIDIFGGDITKTPGVYQQGLMVYGEDGSLIYEKLLDESITERVVDFCERYNLAVAAYCGERIFSKRICSQIESLKKWNDPDVETHAPGVHRLGDIGVQTHKLILIDQEDVLQRMRPLLADALGTTASLTKAVPGMLEVLPPGASKGEGVSVLLNHINVPADNVVAFGDGENDLEMFELARLGIAVDNARDILKKSANAVTRSNDEEGVASALELLMKTHAARLGSRKL